MDIHELKKRKKALKLTTARLADLAMLPYGTVSKIMTGETRKPSYVTIERLDRALIREEMAVRLRAYIDAILAYMHSHPDEDVDQIEFERKYREKNNPAGLHPIREGAESDEDWYQNDGGLALFRDDRVRVQQLLNMDEDRRVELIDGHLIVSEYPNLKHQIMVQSLGRIIDKYIDDNKGPCRMINVGVNVRLDRDDYTLVGPDIVVVCDGTKFDEMGITGAPDWVIEVTSPGTRSRDYKLKLHKYMNAGVREYWIIDLQKEKVITYTEGELLMATVYDFTDDVPVYIYDGRLKIRVGDIGK